VSAAGAVASFSIEDDAAGAMDDLALWYAINVGERCSDADFDFVTAITGRERIGKSTLAMWLLQMTEPGARPVDRVAFTPLEYLRLFKSLPPGRAPAECAFR